MKSIRLFLGLPVIGLLMLVPGLAHAQGVPATEAEGRLRGFEGELVNRTGVAGEEGVLTIRDLRTGEDRSIRMTSSEGQPDFRIKTPGNSELPGVASPMKRGAGVAVLARQVGGQWMAVEVLVKPEEPTIAPRTGVVIDSDSNEGTITIVASSGITSTLQLEAGAPAPSDGDLVIAFAKPVRGNDGATPTNDIERVTGLTRAAEVRNRLERHLDETTSDEGDLNGIEQEVKANHVESLVNLLDQQSSNHFERLEKALDHTSTRSNKRALVGALIQTGDARRHGKFQAHQVRNRLAEKADKSVGEDGSNNDRGQGNHDTATDESGKYSGKDPSDAPGNSSNGRGEPKGDPAHSSGKSDDDYGRSNEMSSRGDGNSRDKNSDRGNSRDSESGKGNSSKGNAGNGNSGKDKDRGQNKDKNK